MAARRWTEAQRQAASQRALAHKPWLHATGPRTDRGKKHSSANAVKHGMRGQAMRSLYRALSECKRVRRGGCAAMLQASGYFRAEISGKTKEIADHVDAHIGSVPASSSCPFLSVAQSHHVFIFFQTKTPFRRGEATTTLL